MTNRIQEIIDKENTTASAFADEIGISRGAMNHILNGRNKASLDVLMKILDRYKNINTDWLMFGKLPMYKTEMPIIQRSLFDENAINETECTAHDKYEQENEDKEALSPPKQPNPQQLMPEFSISGNIDKIIIFFKDKTFITLKPEEE
ncbi:transcriptional regulator with XRE-family HTH domain [Dysgonomonadaceae bacterium PH5-43]|nr:transcriptional regulator with XRE-family HTH domain [Dysgonomonadaceae bacterium PH5-43]